MKHPRINRHTAERMLRGQPTGPPQLARLLAAAKPRPETSETDAEAAALTAFRTAGPHRAEQPGKRRVAALLKAALIGLIVLLTGGVAVAATAGRLPAPLGNKPAHHSTTPATSNRGQVRIAPGRPVHPTPQHTPRPEHSWPASRWTNKAHNDKEPKGKAKGKEKGNPHEHSPTG